ncbi:MAG TPA: ABC transporter permease [bacterium]|nr:ABC transporter permease [bacterium]
MRLLALIDKELRTFLREPALVFVVAYSLLWAPYQAASQFTFELNRYPVAVYDLDQSAQSRAFVDRLRPPYLNVRRVITREREIDTVLERDEASAVIVIPENFSRRLAAGGAASVQVISDGTYTPTSQIAGAYVAGIAQQFLLARQQPASRRGTGLVDARVRIRYNEALISEWYRGLEELFSTIMIIAMLLPAALMVREKEQGTVEQLLVSPIRPWEIMAAKILPMALLTVLGTLGSLGILARAFDMPVRGSLALFIVATMLVVIATGGLGLLIATAARTLPTALIMAFVLHIPISFLSGTITPIEAMPPAQYYLTLLSPYRYYLEIGYGVVLKGAPLSVLWPDLAGLTVLGAAMFAVGAWRFLRQFG